jgi:hypothetical protein
LLIVFSGGINLLNYRISTPTSTTRPTNTFILTQVLTWAPTSVNSNCILWSSLAYSDVGKSICIYGRISEIYSDQHYAQYIMFQASWLKFYLRGNTVYHTLIPKECIIAIGRVYEYSSSFRSFYMDLDEIELREYNGCP